MRCTNILAHKACEMQSGILASLALWFTSVKFLSAIHARVCSSTMLGSASVVLHYRDGMATTVGLIALQYKHLCEGMSLSEYSNFLQVIDVIQIIQNQHIISFSVAYS